MLFSRCRNYKGRGNADGSNAKRDKTRWSTDAKDRTKLSEPEPLRRHTQGVAHQQQPNRQQHQADEGYEYSEDEYNRQRFQFEVTIGYGGSVQSFDERIHQG